MSNATKKTAPKPKRSDRDKKGQFVKGNKVKEVWTEATVMPILEKMWEKLTTDINGEKPEDGNWVRANDIKLQGEICLMFDVDPDLWTYWKQKFQHDPAAGVISPVGRLIKKICSLLESRLVYSGASMDIFTLKAHYGYKDTQNMDFTSKGEGMAANPFLAFLKVSSMDEPAPKPAKNPVKKGGRS